MELEGIKHPKSLKRRFFRRVRKIVKCNCSFRRVCPYFCSRGKLGSHWTFCQEMWNMKLFRKSVKENRIWLMSDMDGGCFTWKPVDIYVRISLNYFWNEKCFKVLEKVKSHNCMFSSIFRKSCSLRDNMQNIVVSDRPQMKINMANDFCTLDK